MTVKRSLGRGLNELLSTVRAAEINSAVAKTATQTVQAAVESPRTLPIDLLQPGKYQPRKIMQTDALQELADSIRAQGILQPILVRSIEKNRYEIIAGERRWRAAQLAALEHVPVFIREIPDEAAMAMGLIENIQREDLNVVEQAIALKRLIEEFELTHEDAAKAVGKSRVSVSNLLRLLNLEPQVRVLLENGDIEMGHARAILALESSQQLPVAKVAIEKELSVRATEELVRKWQSPTEMKKPIKNTDPDILKLQSELSDKLGAAVKIQHAGKGKGKLVIQYYTLDELDGILQRIR